MKTNHWQKIGCAVLVCVFLLTLTACGGLKKEDVAGTYELVSMTTEDNSVNEKTILDLRQMGFVATLEIKLDGTAEMNVYGKQMSLTYDLNRMVFRMDGDVAPFTYEDGTLTFTQDGNLMTFRKNEVSGSDKS